MGEGQGFCGMGLAVKELRLGGITLVELNFSHHIKRTGSEMLKKGDHLIGNTIILRSPVGYLDRPPRDRTIVSIPIIYDPIQSGVGIPKSLAESVYKKRKTPKERSRGDHEGTILSRRTKKAVSGFPNKNYKQKQKPLLLSPAQKLGITDSEFERRLGAVRNYYLQKGQ